MATMAVDGYEGKEGILPGLSKHYLDKVFTLSFYITTESYTQLLSDQQPTQHSFEGNKKQHISI